MLLKEAFDKDEYNALITHPVQTWEWGIFRQNTGITILRLIIEEPDNKSAYSLTITFHAVPHTGFTVGYLPRGPLLSEHILEELKVFCKKFEALFIRMEPDFFCFPGKDESLDSYRSDYISWGLKKGKERFTPYSFLLDVQEERDVLLKNCHKKTRYNIRLAGRKGVEIRKSTNSEALETFCRLMDETTSRQGFYSHGKSYFSAMANQLIPAGFMWFLEAVYENEIITSWIVFKLGNRFYYPYGASSHKHKEVMASNLIMWKAIEEAKENKCHDFDMWGCMGPDPDTSDAWYGFHRFKKSYNPELIEFIGTWDLIINKPGYVLFNLADKLRWSFLRLKSKLR